MSTLRQLFGPSKAEIWRKLCAETGADFVQGGFWKGDKVQATHGEWTLTLDTFAVSTGKAVMLFTRLRAPFVNPDKFRFTIYRRSVFSDLGKFLGMQDIEVGHPEFDRDFIIKGTDTARVRALFANARVRELIMMQPQIYLTVCDDEGFFGAEFPPDTDELCFRGAGVIKDVERMKHLFELFAETLDQLCRAGSAYDRAPGVKL